MLHDLFPKAYCKFLSMPLLGPIAEGFDDWLAFNGYTRNTREYFVSKLPRVDADLRNRQVKGVAALSHAVLYGCWKTLSEAYPGHARTVRTLERYLAAGGLITSDRSATAISPAAILTEKYGDYLREVRGFASSTISNHRYTAQCFLEHLEEKGTALKRIQVRDLESHIATAGKCLSRASLQQHIGALRGFLQFLAMDGKVPSGLGGQVDAPRVYRFEQLPRTLPWETVRILLRSIDRTSAKGVRDYAMFLLIATYGLRTREVVAITLDDICWRQDRLRIHQSKTLSPLELPLTNEVSSAIVRHLKRTPPPSPYRRIFLRMRAPIGVLKRTAVGEAFQCLVRKSGLPITSQGPHCMRHSLAVHLLKSGTPLKTIGDILGHRSAASTLTYLRLATEDLREVPLPVPDNNRHPEEVQQ
jgi:site-specific recombinase XerD